MTVDFHPELLQPKRTTRERISRVELRASRARSSAWRDACKRLALFLEGVLAAKAVRGEISAPRTVT